MPSSATAPPPTTEALAEARWQASLRSVQQRLRAGRDRTPLVLPDFGDQHEEEVPADADQAVPYWLRLAGAWGWRFLVLAAVGWVLLSLTARLAQVIVPLAIALLLAALLSPAVQVLRHRLRLPASLATAVVLFGGVLGAVGLVTLLVTQLIDGTPELSENASAGLRQIREWLRTGPLHLSTHQLDAAVDAGGAWVRDNRQNLTSGLFATAGASFQILVTAMLILVVTFFFLRDGRRLWHLAMIAVPRRARRPVLEAGNAGWLTLVAYVRATVIVAFIDALGIGLALVLLRVEFAFVLAALVFLASFIPILGATVSGAVAVLVALVDQGPVTAVIVLAAVILVQQLEGHVLQPLIMGRAVSIHPLAVIVALAAGVAVAGIVGALVAVPIVAVLNTALRHLMQGRQPAPDAVVVTADPTP
ncbi:AI-2E family transporter [Catellatospora sp. IY07-71]|uniref:AI-2E family transporter n=1 Tax=Catellatospora sp. IY07-71 TaxID=2728827 RepID=UPI001BB3FA48|nr:AI-2E family transporter [Catellatospora sp. IY07-71]BCJ76512.1 AI-2E family transporter [Catellatospora sp. IY07-71]